MSGKLLGAVTLAVLAVACGGSAPPPAKPSADTSAKPAPAPSEREIDETSGTEPFAATSGPGDAPIAFVRDERSSQLDVSLPPRPARARAGERAHESWRAPLEGDKRAACRGPCSLRDRSFVLTAGNRVAVTDPDAWELFDNLGRRIDRGKIETGTVRLDRVGGTVVPDESRAPDASPDTRIASRNGLVVTVTNGSVHVGERAIEGKFDAFDVAIDGSGVACVVVRQAKELFLWTVPLMASGSIGRQKMPATGRHPSALGPPVLGRRLRVFSLDTGLLALALDGKRAWEVRGLLPTGGVTITADDVVLVADGGRISAIDLKGKVEELHSAKDVVFVTPPIVNADGVVFVASGGFLHALSFS